MQTPTMVKIKNGMVVLPPVHRSSWKNSEIRIRELSSEKIVLERLAPKRKKVNLDEWKRAAGILKHRRIPNPVSWQRKIRKEWERKFP